MKTRRTQVRRPDNSIDPAGQENSEKKELVLRIGPTQVDYH